MIKKISLVIVAAFILLPQATALYCDQGDNYVTFRSYYPMGDPLNYKNIYLSSALHYNLYDNVIIHLNLVKGRGEPGYFPLGYIENAGGGLYEKGSYYVYFKDHYGFNKIIIGNYTPLFGQGLLFGSVFPLILTNPYYDLARYRDGVNPSGSASKAVLLEGVALEYEYGNIYFRPFVSWNAFDSSAGESSYYKYDDNDEDGIPNDTDPDDFTGRDRRFPRGYSGKTRLLTAVRNTPDYGNGGDRQRRNNLREYMAGVNASARWDRFKAGATAAYTHFNRLVDPYYNLKTGGDKTGHYYRGKDLFSSSAYFKLYRQVELFGEIAWTIYRSLSYYEEFNGNLSSAVGFSGGVRKKIGNTGLILWGAYLPPNLINPHSLELPDGSNNLACGLFGAGYTKGRKRFNNWIYAYSELHNEDYPGHEEAGVSYDLRAEYPIGDRFVAKLKQGFEIIDNHYYAPKKVSYKIPSKVSINYFFREDDYITISVENRAGGQIGERLHNGTGVQAGFVLKEEGYTSSIQLMGYTTDVNRFAYLYPYEKPLYNWRFMPSSLKGDGIAGSAALVKNFKNTFTAGTKLRFNIDFFKRSRNSAALYIMTEYSF